MQDNELVSQGDDLNGHIGSTADQGDNTMEERQEDSKHGVALCHALRKSSNILGRWNLRQAHVTGTKDAATG